ncbi:glycosyltransferase family 20-domain-containing protein [Dimargaris cristalligena]|uniref:Glycosyltransferase family 20-domain-containing protein n=1 Tax=Dimargaris cristalligena TaxID=215637 RepID=A0A4P9ZWZ9_9FUNG|nr:glycosyltransferase family 20-domain-containing protein [Dimargaris cristalligena]|eukprot:RKP38157.1 glycosyltransferase family 20-domain-containing protein [Dimargaris cristalligena]
MYAGIRALAESNPESIHIGSVGEYFDCDGQKKFPDNLSEGLRTQLQNVLAQDKQCSPVFINKRLAFGHYEGYCKSDLWPLLHYIPWDNVADPKKDIRYWDDYLAVNQLYADEVVRHYRDGDVIWIHDYHLMLVPQLLRRVLPTATIGFFLHAPFPSSELFRSLPRRKEILEGLLGASEIGFQTYSYSRHFISSCTRVLGLESSPKGVDYHGGLVPVGTFPIGIDVESVQASRSTSAVTQKMKLIREMYHDKHIIIGRDKLDQVTGIVQKFKAFEKFLEKYPEWRGQVVLIQVTSPPKINSPRLESRISDMVTRINSTYGSLEFTPIHYHNAFLDRDEYYALLNIASLGLITSVRDGMNTTSHEFVVCQQEKHSPLILSEFTGTASSLSAAIMVNPWDYEGVAEAINEALTMSEEEKCNKQLRLYEYVVGHDAKFWVRSFLNALCSSELAAEMSNITPYLDTHLVVDKYSQARSRLICLDYDGTLSPIVKNPSDALPPPDMLEALEILTANPDNSVWVVSGRDQSFLEEHLGHLSRLGLSAEHGCFIKSPGGSWVNFSENLDLSWKHDVLKIFRYYEERTQGSFVEEKKCAVTWHYRNADPEYGIFQANECQNHLENNIVSKLPVEILVGKKNLEVRPKAINKGEIVKRLWAAQDDCGFVFCAGDDKTDEDMFRAFRKIQASLANGHRDAIFNLTVGSNLKKTMASWHVPETPDVVDCLVAMAKVETLKNNS